MSFIDVQTVLILLVIFSSISNNPVKSIDSNSDYSEKISVRVSELLTSSQQTPLDKAWPPPNAHDFTKININVMGNKIDGATLHALKPDLSKLNAKKLKKLLGDRFDAEWMSVTQPVAQQIEKHRIKPFSNTDPSLRHEVQQLNFTFFDTNGSSLPLQDPHTITLFQNWLLAQSSCPIVYFWDDLSVLFWPRWIKRGRCLLTAGCTWPPGMRCRVSHSRNLHILQWRCSDQSEMELARQKHYKRTANQHNSGNVGSWSTKEDPYLPSNYPEQQNQRSSHLESRDEREKRRVKRRLIKKLSMTTNGYFCRWVEQQYVVNDRCSCDCQSL